MIQYKPNLVKKMIPHVDLSINSSEDKKKIQNLITKLISTNNFILGHAVEDFEKEFARYIKTKYAIGVNSGTDALFLILKALDIGKNDEVILPAMTFMATISAVIHTGARPVLIDSSLSSPNIDPKLLVNKITKRTKAIIPVHINGTACDMDEIMHIAKKHKLFVVEDACQAHGSIYKSKNAGSFGDASAFSFYPSKNLGGFGDAGAITTSNFALYKKLLLLRNHGQTKKYTHTIVGYNSRMDALQAVILKHRLNNLDRNNILRLKKAAYYYKHLSHLPIHFPAIPSISVPNYHNFVILTKERNNLKSYLEENNIQCGIHYPIPIHLQPALSHLTYKKGDFPNAEKYSRECLSLPLYPNISKKDQDEVIKRISFFFNR